jgi:hypothetical protein
MFSLLLSLLTKVCSFKLEPASVPLWTEEQLESFVQLWLVIFSAWIKTLCFCCTTLRDVIFVKWYFMSVMSMTCIPQHAVVCWVTTPSSTSSCSSSSRTRHYLEPLKSLVLHLQPPKVLDLWGIEEGGTDLHLHQRNFISLSISLGNLCLVVPWKH